jgi:NMD protein affecting ribosome stability and mRNA decay
MTSKVCTKCGIEKPIEAFYFRKDQNLYIGHCRPCGAEIMRQSKTRNNWRKTEHGKAAIAEYMRSYRKTANGAQIMAEAKAKNQAKKVDEMRDGYLSHLLLRGESAKLTPEIIEAKRIELALKREIKKRIV